MKEDDIYKLIDLLGEFSLRSALAHDYKDSYCGLSMITEKDFLKAQENIVNFVRGLFNEQTL